MKLNVEMKTGSMTQEQALLGADHALSGAEHAFPCVTGDLTRQFACDEDSMSICHLHVNPEVYPEQYKVIPDGWNGDVDARVNSNFVTFVKGSRSSLGWAKMYIALVILFQLGAHKMSLDFDESDLIPIDDNDLGISDFNSRGHQVCFEQKVPENSSSAQKSLASSTHIC